MGTDFDAAFSVASKGRVLKPRFRVLVGKLPVEDQNAYATTKPDTGVVAPKSATIERIYNFGLDRFKIVVALCKEQDCDFWASFLRMVVEVEMYYEDLSPPKLMFHGVTENVRFDLHRGEVTLEGRNTGALLVNQTIQRTQQNLPTQDEVRQLVEPFGFKVDFGRAGPEGDFGFVVNDDKHHIATGFQSPCVTVWDKLARMALEKQCSLYEHDGVIYFHKDIDHQVWTVLAPTRQYDASGHVCKLAPSNSTALRFSHDLYMANYNSYVLENHNFHGPEIKKYVYPEDASKFAKDNPIYVKMALKSDEDARAAVQGFQQSTGSREWHVEWTSSGPEMLDITLTDLLEVSGTESGLDGPYQVISIEHVISWDRGLSTTVTGQWGRSNESGGGSGTGGEN